MRTPNLLTRIFKTLGNVALMSLAALSCLNALPARAQAVTTLTVDARDISQRILHASLHLPAKPGPLTLVYPKWIPGEHGPTGPITDLTGLKMSAGGKSIPWRRDAEDNYAFNIDVPPGADAVDVSLDFLLASDPNGFSSAASSSANVGAVSWNTVVLYPKGAKANSITYAAHIRLPNGWKYATALQRAGEANGEIGFAPVTLERLIDSPLMAGRFVRTFDLSPGGATPERLNLIADSSAALDLSTNDQASFAKLAAEANALFGAHHYEHYDFLLTLSDEVAHFGLEHHESSDDRGPERMLIEPDMLKSWAYLLPHEMVHSWNGKYRRPAGLATPDYQQPMKTELLWVYEGLTEYLGEILTARSGLWNATNYTQFLALDAAMLDHRRGRDWRPLVDTTDAAHLLYNSRGEGESWRRGTDFYPEGSLIWLEADVTIRQLTKGKSSLDNFCQSFFGGGNTPPKVVPYTVRLAWLFPKTNLRSEFKCASRRHREWRLAVGLQRQGIRHGESRRWPAKIHRRHVFARFYGRRRRRNRRCHPRFARRSRRHQRGHEIARREQPALDSRASAHRDQRSQGRDRANRTARRKWRRVPNLRRQLSRRRTLRGSGTG
jgi:predicted metalloprotease with PDZ domain